MSGGAFFSSCGNTAADASCSSGDRSFSWNGNNQLSMKVEFTYLGTLYYDTIQTSGINWLDGTWRHVAYNMKNGQRQEIFVDGSSKMTGSNLLTYSNADNGKFVIGKSREGNYRGALSHFALYSTVLTQTQITDHATGTSSFWHDCINLIVNNNPSYFIVTRMPPVLTGASFKVTSNTGAITTPGVTPVSYDVTVPTYTLASQPMAAVSIQVAFTFSYVAPVQFKVNVCGTGDQPVTAQNTFTNAVTLPYGASSIVVTTADGVYTINTYRQPPAISALVLTFIPAYPTTPFIYSPLTPSYTGTIPATVTSVSFQVTFIGTASYTFNSGSSVTLTTPATINLNLAYGTNTIVITSTEASQGTLTYTYTLTRVAASPSALTVVESVSTGLATLPSVTPISDLGATLTGIVPYQTKELLFTATCTAPPDLYHHGIRLVLACGQPLAVPLLFGSNLINVTSVDGSYLFAITRRSLSVTNIVWSSTAVSLSSAPLTMSWPTYADGTFSYSGSVSMQVSTAQLTPTFNQSISSLTINVNGVNRPDLTNNIASPPFALNFGNNVITLTSIEATTQYTFTYQIYRALPVLQNVLFSRIKFNGTHPTFNPMNFTYNGIIVSSSLTLAVTSILSIANTPALPVLTVNGRNFGAMTHNTPIDASAVVQLMTNTVTIDTTDGIYTWNMQIGECWRERRSRE